MSYYPKSRIITNQKSNPGEFTNENGMPYSGDYFITFDGRYFSGKDPQSPGSFPLKKINSITTTLPNYIQSRDNKVFASLNKGEITVDELLEPSQYYPKPTEEDYKIGKITRYFAKQRKIGTFKIIEIDKNTYTDLDNEGGIYNYPGWKIISLLWQISGPLHDERPNGQIVRAGIIDTNQRIVEMKDKVFYGIKQYLTDYKQFAK